MQVIENGTIFDGERAFDSHCVIIDQGRISAVVPRAEAARIEAPRFDLQGGTLLPGFNDLQMNGGGGVLFNDSPTVATIRSLGEAHRHYGTTGFLPTLISDDSDKMRQAIAAVEEAIALGVPGVLGIHLEGPLLNPERCGIHDAGKFRPLDRAMLDLLCTARVGRTLVTLAPERCDHESLVALVRRGVIVAAGHTEATFEQICKAQAAGLTGFTHLYNAMSPLQSRAPGAVGAALGREQGWFSIIADGYHVHPAAFRIAVRARQPGAAILVTDAMPTVGSDLQRFQLAGQDIHLEAGKLLNGDGTLAGSHLNMLQAVANATEFAAIDWYEAARMGSLYPARALDLEGQIGRVAPGCRANLLALDRHGNVLATWIDGDSRTDDADNRH